MGTGRRLVIVLALVLAWSNAAPVMSVRAAQLCFPDATQFCVEGSFADYWQEHGGLAINGYPLTGVVWQTLEDGKPYQVQYFERVRMEAHPEQSDRKYQIMLGQFGRAIHPADQPAAAVPGWAYFPETGQSVPPAFADYWTRNGGLDQFGLPLSAVIRETLEDGNSYDVQYFERARFEAHPENSAPQDIQLGQFGRRILASLPPGSLTSSPGAPLREAATVVSVTDGDTIRVQFADGRVEPVRYIGIDTPETKDPRTTVECFGQEAAAKNSELVAGRTVALERDVSDRDKYQRLLRYVWVTGDDGVTRMANEELVKLGYAAASSYPPDVRYQERFRALEQAARDQRLGLWGTCPSPHSPIAAPAPTPTPAPSSPPASGRAAPVNGTCPSGYPVKGNRSSMIYHVPGGAYYDRTSPEECFATTSDAEAAGYRASQR